MTLATLPTQTPQIELLAEEPKRVIPETKRLRAIDPALPQSADRTIHIYLTHTYNEDRLDVVLETNNSDFAWVLRVLSLHLGGGYVVEFSPF